MADSFTSLLTGGLIDTSAPNYAQIAARNERQRQGIIRLGLDQINSIFSGGTAPFFAAPGRTGGFTKAEWRAASPQDKTFYTINKKGKFAPYYAPRLQESGTQSGAQQGAIYGSAVPGIGNLLGASIGGAVGGISEGDYMGAAQSVLSGGGIPLFKSIFGSDRPTPRELVNKRLGKGLLFSAPEYKTFEGFQEPFFEKRAQDYVNFALPQLAEQYRQNREAIQFGLSNKGLGTSSVATKASSELEREAGKGRQTIADTGLAQANQLRQNIEQARQGAIQQLYQTSDPAQALQGAVRSAIGFQAPSTFQPIANLFTNLAQQYVTSRLFGGQPAFGAPSDEQDFGSYLAPIPQ